MEVILIETQLDGFKKRNGTIVRFDSSKIEHAVYMAFDEVARKNQGSFRT